ncbi:hypothetical protein Bpfe_009160 [Biomphalaria pfeifferi]|uniref:PNPLA domain-containing protein n=1 Tax=Biomphalaria pfeifferi TaxID=112525 RepID=A0AAD8FFK1_BIOPF|nr:hypothetical protein Bpfe_009160 [Biomphalaria pfeifferi]
MMSQIKRLAGTSAGAITATFLALGYELHEVQMLFQLNMKDLLFDNSWGYLSLIPNLIRSFGWNPGTVIYQWFGDKIKTKSADRNPDMTFKDLYKERGIELCIVVTNVNRRREEYCHVKTTPDMPIRKALRMTIGIPGLFSAIFHGDHGQMDTYVDGGVLCNYPIHAFDGWYLSMSPEDAFLKQITSLDNIADIMLKRFDKVNDKSLGFILYSDDEEELLRDCLEERLGPPSSPSEPSPPTKLLRERRQKMKIVPKIKTEYERIVQVGHKFMNMLKKYNLLDKEIISKTELARVLQDKDVFPEEDFVLLFGTGADVEKVFSVLDQDGNGMVSSLELRQFVETIGIRIQTLHERYKRLEVNSLLQFSSTLLNTILVNSTSIFVKQSDASRTVGINTGYIDTLDFVLEKADVEFVIQRGYEATKSFLKYYVTQKKADKRLNSQVPRTESSNTEESYKYSNTSDVHLAEISTDL